MKWTDEENNILRDKYPTTPIDDLLPLFPGRNIEQIRYHAKKLRIIKVNRTGAWTPEEVEIITDHYPTKGIDELLEMLPGRTISGIYLKAFGLRLKRVFSPITKPPKPPKPPTNNKVLEIAKKNSLTWVGDGAPGVYDPTMFKCSEGHIFFDKAFSIQRRSQPVCPKCRKLIQTIRYRY